LRIGRLEVMKIRSWENGKRGNEIKNDKCLETKRTR